MKIIAADIYNVDLHPWKPPIILRLITDEGIYGLGEFPLCYGAGRRAAIGMLQDLIEGFVIGADPMRIEAMWDTLFRRTFWAQGGGPVVYGGMSTVDEALWDIKGKALGCPVYELLGGKVRESLRVYANGWYSGEWAPENGRRPDTPQEYGEIAARVVGLGYGALKFNPFGAPRDRQGGGHPHVLEPWRADLGYARVEAVREAVGPQVDIMVECHGWFDPTSAIEMGRRLADLNPWFYEEPVDAMNVACMKQVAENVSLKIAAGERLYTRYMFREYIEGQVLNLLQPDVGLAGGITEVKKIASYAEIYGLTIQPHNCHGPIATAAAAQIDACIPNFLIQELVPFRERIAYDLVLEPLELEVKDGQMPVPDGPGLGVTLNESLVDRCPHIRIE
ncbi:MAG: mandelate racemase/muconate lactonizing enzyme family protein [Anaerolineae bacterium]|nr:mandelate racemase/muconate lactonizing enzyme family protein [Anaerolineae bacterium]